MFNVEAFLDTLPIMGMGMAGIFIVTAAIIFTMWLLGKLTSPKKKTDDKPEESKE